MLSDFLGERLCVDELSHLLIYLFYCCFLFKTHYTYFLGERLCGLIDLYIYTFI